MCPHLDNNVESTSTSMWTYCVNDRPVILGKNVPVKEWIRLKCTVTVQCLQRERGESLEIFLGNTSPLQVCPQGPNHGVLALSGSPSGISARRAGILRICRGGTRNFAGGRAARYTGEGAHAGFGGRRNSEPAAFAARARTPVDPPSCGVDGLEHRHTFLRRSPPIGRAVAGSQRDAQRAGA